MKRLAEIVTALACVATAAVLPVLSCNQRFARNERDYAVQENTSADKINALPSSARQFVERFMDAHTAEAEGQLVRARQLYEEYITQFGSSYCVEDLLRVNMLIAGSIGAWKDYADKGYTREQAERLANSQMHTLFLDRGLAAHEARNHSLAVVYLRFATCEHGYPLNPKAHRLLAESCAAIGDHAAAKKEFEIAADLWPGMYTVPKEYRTLTPASNETQTAATATKISSR